MADNDKNKKNVYRRKKAMLRRTHKKIGIAFIVVIAILLVLIAQIFKINYTNGDVYSKAVLDHQSYTSTTLPNKRGQIIDSNGTILAYSERVYNLILDPKLMLSDSKFKDATIQALTESFDITKENIEQILSEKKDSHYEKVLTDLPSDKVLPFKDKMNDTKQNPYIKGVWFEDSYIRKYPFSSLACDTIGFASPANGGELGIENYYDDELSGTDGVAYSYVDDKLDVQETTKNPVDGNNIVTTIDYNVQNIIEKHIKEYNEKSPSKETAVLVMDPNNGEILGMANYPTFDLNNPRDISSAYKPEELEAMSDEQSKDAMYSLWSNYCVSNIYEPGSTFKPFTVAAGLEEGCIHDDDKFNCPGYIEVNGMTIRCHSYSKGGHGEITLEQSVMESCNPAMVQIISRLGSSKLSKYQSLFGFGDKTGIDLPGEEGGIIKGEDMSELDAATNSFGQCFNVNMIQMAAGLSSLINGGNYYQPHVVKRIEKPSGEVVKSYDATLVRQTVTASTSQLIRKYLKSTVDSGLAKRASVTGYSIAGKTGTAQKLPRADKKWLVSFLGFAPADDPKFVIYVIIDEPDGTTGTEGSTPDTLQLTHDILEDLLPYMNVYKDAGAEPVDTSQSTDESMVTVPEN